MEQSGEISEDLGHGYDETKLMLRQISQILSVLLVVPLLFIFQGHQPDWNDSFTRRFAWAGYQRTDMNHFSAFHGHSPGLHAGGYKTKKAALHQQTLNGADPACSWTNHFEPLTENCSIAICDIV
jgi:hypothetical protein